MKLKELKKRLKELDKKYDDFEINVDDNCGGGYTLRKLEIIKSDQGIEIIWIS